MRDQVVCGEQTQSEPWEVLAIRTPSLRHLWSPTVKFPDYYTVFPLLVSALPRVRIRVWFIRSVFSVQSPPSDTPFHFVKGAKGVV